MKKKLLCVLLTTAMAASMLAGCGGKKAASEGTDVSNYMQDISKDSLSVVAKIGWTTTSHTGGAVPVFAVGAQSGLFAGRQDNTDIPEKICRAMGVKF